MSELVSCPHCGGESVIKNCGRNKSVIRCNKGCTNKDDFTFVTNEDKFKEQAIESWNTRAESTCEGCKYEGTDVLDYSLCDTCARAYPDNYKKVSE